jgi:hypothetical protein
MDNSTDRPKPSLRAVIQAAQARRRAKSRQIEGRADLPRRRGISRESREIRDFIVYELATTFERMTVRQVFYQCASVAMLVDKTENGYVKVQRQVLAMRHAGELDWSFIADGTRWQRKPSTWDSGDSYLDSMLRGYRRDLWQSQKLRIEIWLEKDALADVITDTCVRWDVPLMVSRGQSSTTFIYNAAMEARRAHAYDGSETVVYTLYDHDAAGALRAHPTIARQLPEFAGVPVTVNRLAVTAQQIRDWNLPTRPAKKGDKQAAQWGNRPNVELDAIDPTRLNELVEDAVVSHIDERKWKIEQSVEAEEKDGMAMLQEIWDQRYDNEDDTE